MIEVMNEIGNHFIYSTEVDEFSIVNDGILGSFENDYIAGMYLIIRGSILNDHIYKIESVTNSKLTFEEKDLKPEDTDNKILLVSSTPPNSFINLCSSINNFVEKVGIESEKVDDYSVKFKNGGNWEEAYKSKLHKYRRIYDDLYLLGYGEW